MLSATSTARHLSTRAPDLSGLRWRLGNATHRALVVVVGFMPALYGVPGGFDGLAGPEACREPGASRDRLWRAFHCTWLLGQDGASHRFESHTCKFVAA